MGRKVVKWLVVAGVALTLLYLAGPRVTSDTSIYFDPASIGSDPATYIATAEAKVPGIRDGLAKEIVWANPDMKARTPISIVYVHGFSASKG